MAIQLPTVAVVTPVYNGAKFLREAMLSVQAQTYPNLVHFVLDNASPRALAFGPAHVSGTAEPGSTGNVVMVAHRDTHFAFLRGLRADDEIAVETARGAARYRVREVSVVDKSETRVLDAASAQLTLITCYPFNAVRPGTSLRYVVIADLVT